MVEDLPICAWRIDDPEFTSISDDKRTPQEMEEWDEDKRGASRKQIPISIFKNDGSTIDIEDRCDPSRMEKASHAENVVGKLLKGLDGNRKRVILLRLEGNTLDEIGAILKCSRQRVSDMYSSAISRLKCVASMNGINAERPESKFLSVDPIALPMTYCLSMHKIISCIFLCLAFSSTVIARPG